MDNYKYPSISLYGGEKIIIIYLFLFLCVYSFWELTLRCIQNCFDCCYRWLGRCSARRNGETRFVLNTSCISLVQPRSRVVIFLKNQILFYFFLLSAGIDEELNDL